MPTFTVKLPIPSKPANFARRVRTQAGLSSMYVRSQVALPGPNVFSGLGAFFASRPTVLPGPDVFVPFAKRSGLSAFRARVSPTPIFPGRNIFVPFVSGAQNRPGPCKPCGKARYRRGMGDDYFGIGYDPSNPVLSPGFSIIDPAPAPTPISDSLSPFGSLGDTLNPFGSFLGAEDPQTTPQEEANFIAQAKAAGAYSPYTEAPITSANALTLGSVANNAVLNAGSAAATPGTPAYNALLQSGFSAAQIAAAAAKPPVVTGSLIPSSVGSFFQQYGGMLLLGGVGIFAVSLLGKKKGRR